MPENPFSEDMTAAALSPFKAMLPKGKKDVIAQAFPPLPKPTPMKRGNRGK